MARNIPGIATRWSLVKIKSIIHNDFKLLSELIPSMPTAEDASDDEFKPIERIVLYIDDLDRCPSDKVVSVFEAIHLMLAFPLFVVVVGVDIRWAGKSLHQHYPTHLDYVFEENDDKEPVSGEPRSASALDYLEKIFQVPFWLPPMDEEASLNMMNALVPPLDIGTIVVDSTPGEKMADLANSVVPEQAETLAGGQAEDREEAGGAEALSVETQEREFMLSLAGAVGKSPRRLKRFVNTYRILKASCDALERDAFVMEGGKSGTFKAAMTLLAITTGAPRGAIEILRKLSDFKDEDELNKIDSYIKELAEKWKTEEMEYAQEAMSRYRATYETEPLLKDLRYWVQRVARFSFRFGHL